MKFENYNIDIKEKEIVLGNDTIKIKTYIPMKDKEDIIKGIQDLVFSDILINPIKLEIISTMFVIIGYTDIEIENKDYNSLKEIYDFLEYYGYIDAILKEIPKKEYNSLIGWIKDSVEDFDKFKVSIAGTMESLVNSLPTIMENIDALTKSIKDTDLEMVREVYNKLK